MWGYRRRLTRDLEQWQANGWLTADGRASISAELARSGREVGLASALGILASVLLAVAALSFVAAHWQDMPRLLRLALIFSLLWSGYAAAGVFTQRGMPAFADAAILFSVTMFGAAIMLMSQMFHIDGNPPDGILLWWAGALAAGVALRSNPALALTMVLVCLWASMQTWQHTAVYWPFLIGWAAGSAAFLWQRWMPGLHLAGIALAGFIVSSGFLLGTGHDHRLTVVAGLAAIAAAAALSQFRSWSDDITAPVLGYGIATAFAGLFAWQFIETTSIRELIAVVALAFVLVLAAISYGLSHGQRGALWIGYIGFSIEVLALYWKTVGSILDTSLFFLVAGLIVAALAFLAWRLTQRASGTQRSAA